MLLVKVDLYDFGMYLTTWTRSYGVLKSPQVDEKQGKENNDDSVHPEKPIVAYHKIYSRNIYMLSKDMRNNGEHVKTICLNRSIRSLF